MSKAIQISDKAYKTLVRKQGHHLIEFGEKKSIKEIASELILGCDNTKKEVPVAE